MITWARLGRKIITEYSRASDANVVAIRRVGISWRHLKIAANPFSEVAAWESPASLLLSDGH
jgi:hypothetical protein